MSNELTILEEKNKPLAVKLDAPTQMNKLLDDEESPYVESFLNYLLENFLETYVGGSLIENSLFGGSRADDIDLLAVQICYEANLPEISSNVGSKEEIAVPKYTSGKVDDKFPILYEVSGKSKAEYFHMNSEFDDVSQIERLSNYTVKPKDDRNTREMDLTIVPKSIFDKEAQFI